MHMEPCHKDVPFLLTRLVNYTHEFEKLYDFCSKTKTIMSAFTDNTVQNTHHHRRLYFYESFLSLIYLQALKLLSV